MNLEIASTTQEMLDKLTSKLSEELGFVVHTEQTILWMLKRQGILPGKESFSWHEKS